TVCCFIHFSPLIRSYCLLFCFFFFFQAEDGIRDFHVTGVQTCALPISGPKRQQIARGRVFCCISNDRRQRWSQSPAVRESVRGRSEERRVGKECRSRWSGDH